MAACQGPCSHVLQESSAKQIQEPVEQAVPKHHHHQVRRFAKYPTIMAKCTKHHETKGHDIRRIERDDLKSRCSNAIWSGRVVPCKESKDGDELVTVTAVGADFQPSNDFERFRTGQTGDPVTQMPRPL